MCFSIDDDATVVVEENLMFELLMETVADVMPNAGIYKSTGWDCSIDHHYKIVEWKLNGCGRVSG